MQKIITLFSTNFKAISRHLFTSPKFFSLGLFLAVGVDASVVLIVMLLVAMITFLAGIAYGIYLNDKISSRKVDNQLTEG